MALKTEVSYKDLSEEVSGKLSRAVRGAVRLGAKAGQDAVREAAPGSIGSAKETRMEPQKVTKAGKHVERAVVIGKDAVESHAVYPNWGTKAQKAQGFGQKGLDAARAALDGAAEGMMEKGLEED